MIVDMSFKSQVWPDGIKTFNFIAFFLSGEPKRWAKKTLTNYISVFLFLTANTFRKRERLGARFAVRKRKPDSAAPSGRRGCPVLINEIST